MYWSTDNLGNIESPHVGYVNIDTTAPVTAATGLAADQSTRLAEHAPAREPRRQRQPLRGGDHLLHARRRRRTDLQRPVHDLRRRPAHGHLLVGRRRRQHRDDQQRVREHRHRPRPRPRPPAWPPTSTPAGRPRTRSSASRPTTAPAPARRASPIRSTAAPRRPTRPRSPSAGPGSTAVTYFATDAAGNSEQVRTGWVNISNPFAQAAGLAPTSPPAGRTRRPRVSIGAGRRPASVHDLLPDRRRLAADDRQPCRLHREHRGQPPHRLLREELGRRWRASIRPAT